MSATATDRAYVHTKQGILDGRLAGGEMISEGGVAGEIGVSRTPVREAFLQLEAEGFLRLYPRRGALVVPVSATEVQDVMETRALVEVHALERLIAEQVDIRDELDALIDRQETQLRAGDTVAFVELDREFHRALVARTGNAILLSLHDSLRDHQTRMGLAAIARDRDRTREIVDEHRAIVAALHDRDTARARELVHRHLAQTRTLLLGGRAGAGSDSAI